MTIGEKIYELRISRNMSLREFAQLTGVTHTTIARLESPSFGPQKIFLDTIYLICKKLDYNFGKFLMETGYLPDYEKEKEEYRYSPIEQKIISDYKALNPSCQKLVQDTIKQLLNSTAAAHGGNKNISY